MSSRKVVYPLLLAAILVSVGSGPSARAVQRDFMAVLNGGQENPPVGSNAFGVAYLTLNGRTLCYSVTYSGLSSIETAAHIHGASPAGTNTPALIRFPETGSPKNGCLQIDKATRIAIKRGLLYINIHTANNSRGEIRGQIVPVS